MNYKTLLKFGFYIKHHQEISKCSGKQWHKSFKMSEFYRTLRFFTLILTLLYVREFFWSVFSPLHSDLGPKEIEKCSSAGYIFYNLDMILIRSCLIVLICGIWYRKPALVVKKILIHSSFNITLASDLSSRDLCSSLPSNAESVAHGSAFLGVHNLLKSSQNHSF